MTNKSLSATQKALSALSASSAVSAFPERVPDCFTFTMPRDCRCADYALLLSDRYMRWFEDYDPYGVEFDPRSAVLLETAAALLRGDYSCDIRAQLDNALDEFAEDETDGYLYLDGKQLAADLQSFVEWITGDR